MLNDSDEPLGLLAELWGHADELPGPTDELTEAPDEMLGQSDESAVEALDMEEG